MLVPLTFVADVPARTNTVHRLVTWRQIQKYAWFSHHGSQPKHNTWPLAVLMSRSERNALAIWLTTIGVVGFSPLIVTVL